MAATWTKVSNIRGPRGNTTFVGNGPPTATTAPGAIAGDSYIDYSTGDFYTFG